MDIRYLISYIEYQNHFSHQNNLYVCCRCAKEETTPCYWRYFGRGIDYQLLAGPLYIVIFSISGIPMGNIRSSSPQYESLRQECCY